MIYHLVKTDTAQKAE